MKIVALDQRQRHARSEFGADHGLAAAGHAHHDHVQRLHAGVARPWRDGRPRCPLALPKRRSRSALPTTVHPDQRQPGHHRGSGGGFTGDQRFFLGYAQIWRFKEREPALRNQLLTDAHSPGMYRAFVPLTNIDAFYAAFDLKPGDKLYRAPADRVKLW